MKIPVVLITDARFDNLDLSEYGVVGALSKDTVTPAEVRAYVEKYC